MVDDERLAPLGAIGSRLLRTVADAGIQQQIVNIVLADLLEGLLGKALYVTQVVQLEGKYGQWVGGAVVGEGVVGFLGALGVARAQDDFVRLGLLEELKDGLEALVLGQLGG